MHRAQHAEAVVGERLGVDHAQQAAIEIGAAAERIEELAGQRILGDRVDREIAPARGLFDRHRGIAGDDEAFVAAPGLRVAPRQRHVDVAELVHLEALPDRFDAPERLEQRAQAVAGHPEHLEIDVALLGLGQAHQAVAYPAADNQRAAAGFSGRIGDVNHKTLWHRSATA